MRTLRTSPPYLAVNDRVFIEQVQLGGIPDATIDWPCRLKPCSMSVDEKSDP